MIYIDPPYNTGNDFIYKDDYREAFGILSATLRTNDTTQVNFFLQNPKSSGRFHSDWFNMIYTRLRVAKDLLRDDGVIFISIDDNETQNSRQMMNEIFGKETISQLYLWQTDGNFDNQAKVKKCHEYIMAYTKILDLFPAPASS